MSFRKVMLNTPQLKWSKTVPRYHEAQRVVIDLCRPYLKEAGTTCIELGVGAGETTILLSNTFPNTQMITVDTDATALDALEQIPSTEGILADFTDMTLPKADVIVSILSLHHLDDEGLLKALISCRESLERGPLIIADLILIEDEPAQNLASAIFKEHRAQTLSPEEHELLRKHTAENQHHFLTQKKFTSLIEKAGFKRAEIVWSFFNFAVFKAR